MCDNFLIHRFFCDLVASAEENLLISQTALQDFPRKFPLNLLFIKLVIAQICFLVKSLQAWN